MDKKLFEQLVGSLSWANDHLVGTPVSGGRATTLDPVNAKRHRIAAASKQEKSAEITHAKAPPKVSAT